VLGFVRAVVHLCVFTSLLGFSLSIFAQSDPMAPDARPFAPIEGGEIDSISTVNHGLQIHAPVWSIKQRGNLSLSFTLRYNSPSFTKFHDCSYPGKPCVDTYEFQGNGVAFKSSTDVSVSPDVYEPTGSNGQPVFQGYYWIVTTPDSGTHKLAAIGNGNYRAIDATGWLFNEQTFVLTSKDGVSYHYSGQAPTSSIPYPLVFRLLYIEDTNGNRITLNYSSYVSGGVTYYTLSTYTDSFGRTVAAVPTATTDYSGCTGQNPVASAGLWTPPGASSPIKFCSANVVIQTNFFGGAPATKGSWPTEVEAYADPSFLQSVVLPDGTSWTFQYTPLNNSTYNYGELTKVTLPTGGNLSYQWVEDYRVCPNTANQNTYRSEVSSRSVDANDGNGPQTWIYGTATINGQTVPATTDPLGNKTVHTIASVSGNCSLYETQTDYYDNQNNKLNYAPIQPLIKHCRSSMCFQAKRQPEQHYPIYKQSSGQMALPKQPPINMIRGSRAVAFRQHREGRRPEHFLMAALLQKLNLIM